MRESQIWFSWRQPNNQIQNSTCGDQLRDSWPPAPIPLVRGTHIASVRRVGPSCTTAGDKAASFWLQHGWLPGCRCKLALQVRRERAGSCRLELAAGGWARTAARVKCSGPPVGCNRTQSSLLDIDAAWMGDCRGQPHLHPPPAHPKIIRLISG